MSARFRSVVEPDGVRVEARERRLLGRSHPIPRTEWHRVPALRATTRTLEALVGQGCAEAHNDGMYLSHGAAAALSPDAARRIGLPDLGQVSLALTFEGRVESPEGRIRSDWRDARERPIRPTRLGLLLRHAGTEVRLTAALLALAAAADGYNATSGQSVEARVQAWMPVQQALRDALGADVTADAYTQSLTFYQAGAFALDVRETAAGITFDPVLMAREQAASLTDDAPNPIESVDPTEDNLGVGDAAPLLPPEDHRAFLHRAVGEPGATRDAYVVGRNRFVLIDPHLKPLLDIVKAKRVAAPEERRAFVRNPRAALAEVLGERGEEGQTSLFVETAHYSGRVLELGVWDRPKLPWLTKRAYSWLPEGGWQDAHGQAVAGPTLSKAEQQALVSAIHAARAAGEIGVVLQGVPVPLEAAAAFLQGLGVLIPAPPDQASELGASAEPEAVPTEKQVLLIKQNYEGVEYEQPLHPRASCIPAVPPPDRMGATRFKPHQTAGFDWLVSCWRAGWPGILLADDMGLGKTFQALSFLAWIRSNQAASPPAQVERGPILVVAPTALLKNWEAECRLHLSVQGLGARLDAYGPGLRHLKLDPARRADPGETLDVGHLRAADWILTTYETLTDHEQAFARIRYSVVLFDEMQKIKAPDTLNTKAAKTLNAAFVLGLTGTPIENRLEDLWCILDRLTPGYLGDLKSFSSTYGTEEADALRALKRKLDEPVGAAPAVMLRRMKSDVLEGLPNKQEVRYPVEMPGAQAAAYQRIVMEAQQGAGSRKPGDMLRVIHALRGVSLHPDDPERVEGTDARSFTAFAARSARLQTTLDILRAVHRRGEKAILFIESLAMQQVVARGVSELFDLPVLPGIINGGTPGEQRQRIVDGFQAAPRGFGLLVLSPKAAGVGLTITAANHVIHLSRWWNPAVEDQCNDRAYRIGQVRDVTIHLPMAIYAGNPEASFDRTLDALLQQKRALSREMLASPVSAHDTREIFERTIGFTRVRPRAGGRP